MDAPDAKQKARQQQIIEERQQRFKRSLHRLNSHHFVAPHGPHGPHGRPPTPPPSSTSQSSSPPHKSHITWAVFNDLVFRHLGVQPTSEISDDRQHSALDRYLTAARQVMSKPTLTDSAFVKRLATGQNPHHLTDNQKLQKVATNPLNPPQDLGGANLIHKAVQRIRKQQRAAEKQKKAAKRERARAQNPAPNALSQSKTQPVDNDPNLNHSQGSRLTRSAAKKLAYARSASQCCFCPDLTAFDGKELESELIGPFVDRKGNAKLFVHFECACWAPQVYADPATAQLRRVYDEHCRGRQLKCSHCGDRGATIGCYVQRCKKVYHLRCLRVSGAYTVERFFAAFCENHAHLGKQNAYITLMEAATIADVAAAQRREETTFGLDAPHSRYTMLRRRETEVIFSRRWRLCSHTGAFDSTKVLFSHKYRKIMSKRDTLRIADRVKALHASALDIASGRLAFLAVLGEDAPRDDAAAFRVRAALASRDVPSLLLLRNLRRAPEWNKDDIQVVRRLGISVDSAKKNLPPADKPNQSIKPDSPNQTASPAPTTPVTTTKPSTQFARPKRSIHKLDRAENEERSGKSPKRARTTSPTKSSSLQAIETGSFQTVPLESTRLPPITALRAEREKKQQAKPPAVDSPATQRNDGCVAQLENQGDKHRVPEGSNAELLPRSRVGNGNESLVNVPRPVTSQVSENLKRKKKSAWETFLQCQLPKERMLRPEDSMEDSMRNMARLWSLMTSSEREEYERLSQLPEREVREYKHDPFQNLSNQRRLSRAVISSSLDAGLFVKRSTSIDNQKNTEGASDHDGQMSGADQVRHQSKSLPLVRKHSAIRSDARIPINWDEMFPTSLRGIIPSKAGDGRDGSHRVQRVRPPPGQGKSAPSAK